MLKNVHALRKIPIKITVLAQYSWSIFTHTQTHTHTREKLVFDNLLYTEFYTVYNILYTVYSILYCIQYEINRKTKMLQEYWASTVIFIGIFSQCGVKTSCVSPLDQWILQLTSGGDHLQTWPRKIDLNLET